MIPRCANGVRTFRCPRSTSWTLTPPAPAVDHRRELQKAIERAVLRADGAVLPVDNLPAAVADRPRRQQAVAPKRRAHAGGDRAAGADERDGGRPLHGALNTMRGDETFLVILKETNELVGIVNAHDLM